MNPSHNYQQLINGDQRLLLLQTLSNLNYLANNQVLHQALGQYGHRISLSQVNTHLTWLAEQGLLTLDHLGATLVAKLTSHGLDVAQGTARVPGVGVPRPQ